MMFDIIFDWFIAPLLLLLVVLFIVGLNNDTRTKKDLYTECLKTDYDKFQCYSMIYGDK